MKMTLWIKGNEFEARMASEARGLSVEMTRGTGNLIMGTVDGKHESKVVRWFLSDSIQTGVGYPTGSLMLYRYEE